MSMVEGMRMIKASNVIIILLSTAIIQLLVLPGPTSLGDPIPEQSFGGGSGTAGDPYVIEDVWDLQNMSKDLSAHYVLGNDIDASDTINWNSGAGFDPIGTKTINFKGSLDGEGHSINGLFINRSEEDYVGLIDILYYGGRIIDLNIYDSNITGGSYVGGLSGYNLGYIENSSFSGRVSGKNYTGMITGYNIGSISGSHTYGIMIGGNYVGGIVGFQYSYYHYYSGKIENTFSEANVIGKSHIGGLCGSNTGPIIDSFYTGNVSGDKAVGGILGSIGEDGYVSNSFYDVDNVLINGRNHLTIGGLFHDEYEDWFRNNRTLNISHYNDTLIPSGDHYEINAVDGMKKLLVFSHIEDYKFRLSSDIDLIIFPGLHIPFFRAAEFNGNGYKVYNLCLDQDFSYYTGLFGFNSGGFISNLSMVDVNVKGDNNVSGLIGYNHKGDVKDIQVNGIISGKNNIGGVIGSNYNTNVISSSNFNGTINGAFSVGGIVGNNLGNVFNCYSSVNIYGRRNNIGGICGSNTGSIKNSNVYGNLSGDHNVGGIVGSTSGPVSFCRSYSYATGNRSIGCIAGTNTGTISDVLSEGFAHGDLSVGGISGKANGHIMRSRSKSNIDGRSSIGGIAGNSNRIIMDCAFSGKIVSTGYSSGGIVGDLQGSNWDNSGYVMDSVSSGEVDGHISVGGIAGYSSGTIVDSCSLTNVSGILHVGGVVGLYRGIVNNCYYNIDKVLINGIHQVTYCGLFDRQYLDWIQSNKVLNISDYGEWLVQTHDGYDVSSIDGLKYLLGFSHENNIRISIIADIDLSNKYNLHIPYFSGEEFDGNGHKLLNLTVDQDFSNYLGLIGYNDGGTIRDLSLFHLNITGQRYIGGITGYNNGGKITNVLVDGAICGKDEHTGGIVGYNSGNLHNSSSSGMLSGKNVVGGLIGEHWGSLTDSYSSMNINGEGSIGVLVGRNHGKIFNSFYNIDQVEINGMNHIYRGGIFDRQFNDWITNDRSLDINDYKDSLPFSRGFYEISSVQGIRDVLGFSSSEGLRFRMVSDIDLKDESGLHIPHFSAEEFDGNGFTVSNLNMENNFSEKIGFFGEVSRGNIRNVVLKDVRITGTNHVGSLAGSNNGNIYHSYSEGSISAWDNVGLLVGSNSGTILNSRTEGTLNGRSRAGLIAGMNYGAILDSSVEGILKGKDFIGGLAGENRGFINRSFSTTQVKGSVECVGGICGMNTGSISETCSNGEVKGSEKVGGLVGYNGMFGKIKDSYSISSVEGNKNIGGLVGANELYSLISNVYSSGRIVGNMNVGAITGYNGGTIKNSFWDNESSLQTSSAGGMGKSTSELMKNKTYTSAGWDMDDVWWMIDTATRPILRMEWSESISNIHQLQMMAANLSADYELVSDLDLSSITEESEIWGTNLSSGKGFFPIGDMNGPFLGTFDGLDYEIKNLYINNADKDNVGLFGYIGKGGALTNVKISDVYVIGNSYVGGIAGYIYYGYLTFSYSKGFIKGNEYVGGITGSLLGTTISHSFSEGSVKGHGIVGGLAGSNNAAGVISNSYSNVVCDGIIRVGGMVGYNAGKIYNSYSSGRVTGNERIGGMVGSDYGLVILSFWDNETSGQTSSPGGIGKNTSEMKIRITFSNAHWDLSNIWCIAEGLTYPLLRWQDKAPPIANAGNDITIDQGTLLKFNGSASYDDLMIAQFEWTFNIDDYAVVLYGKGPTYLFDRPGTFLVTLTVIDVVDLIDSDTIIVNVREVEGYDPFPPVANAGNDIIIVNGSKVTFDGSASYDNIGIVNYTWTLYDNKTIFLYGVNPTYIFNFVGSYCVTLNVSDAWGSWSVDMINVTVIELPYVDETSPICIAGSDVEINERERVYFDGRGSHDNVGIASYTWTFFDGIEDVVLQGSTPSHIFTVPGRYTITLTVMDEAGNSGSDTMTVSVRDITPPIANAGEDLVIDEGSPVQFDGSESSDNVMIVNYTWTVISGSRRTSLYGVDPVHVFGDPGVYVVTLEVLDGAGLTDSHAIMITVLDATPPASVAGPDRTVDVGTLVIFDGSGSSDNVGIVNYTWTFNDGSANVILYGIHPSHTFSIPGTYTVTLTVRDEAGNEGIDSFSVNVIAEEKADDHLAAQIAAMVMLVPLSVLVLYLLVRSKRRRGPEE